MEKAPVPGTRFPGAGISGFSNIWGDSRQWEGRSQIIYLLQNSNILFLDPPDSDTYFKNPNAESASSSSDEDNDEDEDEEHPSMVVHEPAVCKFAKLECVYLYHYRMTTSHNQMILWILMMLYFKCLLRVKVTLT